MEFSRSLPPFSICLEGSLSTSLNRLLFWRCLSVCSLTITGSMAMILLVLSDSPRWMLGSLASSFRHWSCSGSVFGDNEENASLFSIGFMLTFSLAICAAMLAVGRAGGFRSLSSLLVGPYRGSVSYVGVGDVGMFSFSLSLHAGFAYFIPAISLCTPISVTCIRSFLLVGVTLKFRHLSRSGMTVLSCSCSTKQRTPGCWVAGRRGSWSGMVPGGGGVECWELELVVVIVLLSLLLLLLELRLRIFSFFLACLASS